MNEQEGKPTKTATAFRMTCAVSIDIDAARERIWALLTDAEDFPSRPFATSDMCPTSSLRRITSCSDERDTRCPTLGFRTIQRLSSERRDHGVRCDWKRDGKSALLRDRMWAGGDRIGGATTRDP